MKLLFLAVALVATPLFAQAGAQSTCGAPLLPAEPKEGEELSRAIREHYVKYEYRIPMRDGVTLYTVAYVPREQQRRWPIMLLRTPYGVSWGVDTQPDVHDARAASRFAPSTLMVRDGYIFVHQDVRGRMMSEGQFVDVRPKAAKGGIDEATDTWDTIDFLVKNVPANNGRVGVWGVSYPGFYAAQAAIDAHPALKAVSPQAPVTDWFLGDDFHHNGALFLEDTVGFFAGFGKARPAPTRHADWGFDFGEAGDNYEFYLDLGPLSNVNSRHFKGEIAFWNDLMAHPTYDEFWKTRNPLPRYRVSNVAVLTVGGLFDAQDLYGPFATWRAFSTQSPKADVRLVMGPWRHGGWSRTEGDHLGAVSFAWKTSRYYLESIEAPFFRHYLKDCPEPPAPKVHVFETGTNLFEHYETWPPPDSKPRALYFSDTGFSTSPPATGFDEWVSDPKKPVPYRSRPLDENDEEWVVDDQRFAARRPDVVVHQTKPLSADLTVSGPVDVSLEVSTTGTDADFVVKLIDVYPFDMPTPAPNPTGAHLPGFQQLVRGEVFRGRFRTGFDTPTAFVPGKPTTVHFSLPDVNHTFRPGHRLMVQVQSTWFPLVDLNPQTFVDAVKATSADFKPATHRLYWPRSVLTLPVRRGALP